MHISENDRQNIVDWAGSRAEIRRVWLYGSRARGDHRADSDIDLAIEFETDDPNEATAIWIHWKKEFFRYPTLIVEPKLHLQPHHPGWEDDRVGSGVEKDGILLYSSVPGEQ